MFLVRRELNPLAELIRIPEFIILPFYIHTLCTAIINKIFFHLSGYRLFSLTLVLWKRSTSKKKNNHFDGKLNRTRDGELIFGINCFILSFYRVRSIDFANVGQIWLWYEEEESWGRWIVESYDAWSISDLMSVFACQSSQDLKSKTSSLIYSIRASPRINRLLLQLNTDISFTCHPNFTMMRCFVRVYW